jgi:hypothetical protein
MCRSGVDYRTLNSTNERDNSDMMGIFDSNSDGGLRVIESSIIEQFLL